MDRSFQTIFKPKKIQNLYSHSSFVHHFYAIQFIKINSNINIEFKIILKLINYCILQILIKAICPAGGHCINFIC